jgi:hypothetical protein
MNEALPAGSKNIFCSLSPRERVRVRGYDQSDLNDVPGKP